MLIFHPHFVHNKYFKWYKQLVCKYQSDVVANGENHHIVPKSMGGTDESSNLVRLPIRAHYVAHLLLWKCTTKSSRAKMAFAVTTMRMGRSTSLRFNSRTFLIAKLESAQLKHRRKGYFSAVDAFGNSFRIKKDDPRFISGELTATSKGRLLGRRFSDEHKARISSTKLTTDNPNHKWYVKTPIGTFSSLGDAASAHNTNRGTISNRCKSTNPKFKEWELSPTPFSD